MVQGDLGTAAWISCAGKPPWTLPDDQLDDDVLSLTYDWPLEEELELLGHPRLRVTITSPHPVAFLSARLCDVFPGRRIGPREPGRLESHPPREPLPAEAAQNGCSDLDRPRARGDVVDLRGGPPPAARARGLRLAEHLAAASRRDARGRTGHRSRLELPVLEGTPVAAPPVFSPPPPANKLDEPDIEQPPTVRLIEHDTVGPQTRVVTSYGSRTAPTTRRSRRCTTAWWEHLQRAPAVYIGERANALLDRVAGGVRYDRSAPQFSFHISSVSRRRRGRRLGRRSGRHRPCRAPVRAHHPAPAAIARSVAGRT